MEEVHDSPILVEFSNSFRGLNAAAVRSLPKVGTRPTGDSGNYTETKLFPCSLWEPGLTTPTNPRVQVLPNVSLRREGQPYREAFWEK